MPELPANSTIIHHVVAIPFPGRGHVNPMMNLCKLIAQHHPSNLLITFIVTEEWLGFIETEPKPNNIRFATIPNVIPSELIRASVFTEFFHATLTNMEEPVEEVIRRMKVPVNVIVYDTNLMWVVNVGRRMNVPVASFFSMSATVFSMFYYYHLLVENCHAGDNFSENMKEIIDYIPGVSPVRVADLLTCFNGKGKEVRHAMLEAISMGTKAQFLLFGSIYELEPQAINSLKSELTVPIYTIGPTIPYFSLKDMQNDQNTPEYIKWLDRQPMGSVLYISQGSFLSVTDAQLDETIAGILDSGVRYMWITRGEKVKHNCENDEKGLVIPWCDQLRVLCNDSIGAFWSHCRWNSTKEGAFSGVPMLTFPIFFDQVPNSKMIVEDWKTGMRVLAEEGIFVTRKEISKLVRSFMDPKSEEGKEMRKRAKEVRKICQEAVEEGGSAKIDIDSFISDISSQPVH